MEWYRAYHGMPYNPKLQVIAKRTGHPLAHVLAIWLCLLDAASQNRERGVALIDSEEIAIMQGLEIEAVKAILKALHDRGMVDDRNRLTGWDKAQYTTSSERVKKYRNKKRRVTRSNAVKRDVTPRNAAKRQKQTTEKNRTKTRAEKKQSRAEKNKTEKKENRESAEKIEREEEKQQIGEQKEEPILEQMLDIWNAEVQQKLTIGHKANLTPKRREMMAERWLEDFQQDMRAWRYYCEVIGNSDFCLGRIKGKDWTIDLTWAIESSDHVAKILEGGFSGGSHPPKPPACELPTLQEAWDAVLRAFQKKYGSASCRCWLSNTTITAARPHPDGATVILRCPSKFVREWIAQHYLPDLKHWWAEVTATGARVAGVELTTEG